MNIQRKKYDQLQYDLGRYKKKVSDDAKVISDLRDRVKYLEASMEAKDASYVAIVSHLLEKLSASKAIPVKIPMDGYAERIENYPVFAGVDAEERMILMFIEEQNKEHNNSAET